MNKSAAIVHFIANLLPLYQGERHGEEWCARSLHDGTLILPLNIEEDPDDGGWIRIHWQGDRARLSEVQGAWVATIALERYVRLHGAGASEESIANELWFMAEHFHFKTGCHVELPQLSEPAHPLRREARHLSEMGRGVIVNMFSKFVGI